MKKGHHLGEYVPGDSIRDLFFPNVGGHQKPLSLGHFSSSQKGHENAELPGLELFPSTEQAQIQVDGLAVDVGFSISMFTLLPEV